MNINTKKPIVKLIGQDSNIFNLMGIASKALKKANLSKQAEEMTNKIMNSSSYYEALNIIREYYQIK